MMDEQETKEWALRESEIEKLQEARLALLKKMLKQREETNKNLTTKRLDKLWKMKQEDKETRCEWGGGGGVVVSAFTYETLLLWLLLCV